MKLLSEAAAGNGTAYQTTAPGSVWKSHVRTLYVWGTFDGSTVKLQISADNINWFDVTDADTITAKTAINIEARYDWVRGVVTGGTSPSISMILR